MLALFLLPHRLPPFSASYGSPSLLRREEENSSFHKPPLRKEPGDYQALVVAAKAQNKVVAH